MSKRLGIFDAFFESQWGGTQVAVKDMVDFFVGQGIRPFVICLGRENAIKHLPTYSIITVASKAFEYDLLPEQKGNRIKWFRYHIRRFYNKNLARNIARVFAQNDIEHVHLQNLSVASYALPACLVAEGLKVTAFFHDYEWIMPSTLLSTPAFHPIRILRRYQARRAKPYIQRYIAVSKFVQRRLYESLGNDIICEVLYPLDMKPWRLQRTPTPGSKRIVRCIYSGSLRPSKGIIQFLNQLNRLDISWLEVSIYGDGPQRSEVEQYRSDRIKICGRVAPQEMRDIFAEGDFTIVPSFSETFGRVVFEAVLSGCPVLATNRGGLTEQQSLLPGILLYDPDDIQTLEQQLARMRKVVQSPIDPTLSLQKIQEKNGSVLNTLVQEIVA